jgi:hypothetical protein
MIIEKKFVKVINQDGSLAVADYFENARIETEQTLESGDLNNISTTGLLPLPDEGEEVLQQLYAYNNKVVYCRQKHNRTIYPPEQTPALFSFFRDETGDLSWIEGELVKVGWIREHEDVEYEAITEHMTLPGWEPDNTPTLWKEYTGDTIPVWNQPTGTLDAYQLGDQVHYPTINDQIWISKINANTTVPDGDEPYNRYWEPVQ